MYDEMYLQKSSIRLQGNSGLQVNGYRMTGKTHVKVLGWKIPTLDNFESDDSQPGQLTTGKLLPWRISTLENTNPEQLTHWKISIMNNSQFG